MNLFVTDSCPVKSAQALDDKRVGKLLMEVNQMMSLAIKEHDPFGDWECGPGLLTNGLSHLNHPVSIWVRTNISNFEWCLAHAYALYEEHQVRYGTEHASGYRTPYIASKRSCLPEGDLLPFQNNAKHDGLGIDYTHLEVPSSYREYLMERWDTDTKVPTWNNRGEPSWRLMT